eukprot:m.190423 g.190423  ORF g.190423 m.190423 type:complete len:95 (-) comp18561_c0_seq1:528-812(-)
MTVAGLEISTEALPVLDDVCELVSDSKLDWVFSVVEEKDESLVDVGNGVAATPTAVVVLFEDLTADETSGRVGTTVTVGTTMICSRVELCAKTP